MKEIMRPLIIDLFSQFLNKLEKNIKICMINELNFARIIESVKNQ